MLAAYFLIGLGASYGFCLLVVDALTMFGWLVEVSE